MYRTVSIAVIALAAITLPAATSLALGLGGGAGTFGMASGAPAVSPVAAMGGGVTAGPPPKRGGGTATPRAKKLSPKGGAACFRACMRGVSGAGWGNFCDYSCYGG